MCIDRSDGHVCVCDPGYIFKDDTCVRGKANNSYIDTFLVVGQMRRDILHVYNRKGSIQL